MSKTFVAAGLMSAALLAGGVQAATDISMWHAMTGSLGDWVQDLANDFNKSQQNCRLTPTDRKSVV